MFPRKDKVVSDEYFLSYSESIHNRRELNGGLIKDESNREEIS